MKLVCYRPSANEISKGGAFQFSLSKNKRQIPSLFIEAASQVRAKPAPGSKDSPFDWESKLTLKAEVAEVGTLLATLRKNLSETKFFHKYENGSITRTSEFKLAPGEKGSFGISLRANEGETKRGVQIYLTAGEAVLLEELCVLIIRSYYNHTHRRNPVETSAVS